ncbi:MAG: hypothetical protein V8Q91_00190 [Bilophila wadsworthia]
MMFVESETGGILSPRYARNDGPHGHGGGIAERLPNAEERHANGPIVPKKVPVATEAMEQRTMAERKGNAGAMSFNPNK